MGETFLPLLFGGISNAASTTANIAANNANVNKQLAAQKENQAAQNEWQAGENEKDRQFQMSEWTRQFGAENEEWQRRFDLENQYNSPTAVISRLNKAGINPAAALGQLTGTGGLAAAGGSSSPTSPAMAPPHQVSAMGISPVGSLPNISSIGQDISSMIKTVAEAKKAGVETTRLKELLPVELRQKLAETGYQEALTSYTKFQQTIDEAFKGKKLQAETEKLLAEVETEVARAFALFNQGEKDAAHKLFFEAQERLVNSKDRALTRFIPYISQYSRAMIANLFTSSEKNVSEAEHFDALTATINLLRGGQFTAQELSNNIAQVHQQMVERENNRDFVTNDAQIFQFYDQLHQQQLITFETKELLDKAVKENKYYVLRLFDEHLESVTRSVGNVVGSLTGAQRSYVRQQMADYVQSPKFTKTWNSGSGKGSASWSGSATPPWQQ